MKRFAVLVLLLGLFVLPAQASITTYYWHQTSATMPGLVFTGQYAVTDGTPPIAAGSSQMAPDFGGLVSFMVQGGGVSPVTLADLTPACTDPSSCLYGMPDWTLAIAGPNVSLFFIDATDSFDYTITSHSIAADSDAPSMCNQTGACQAAGYWSASAQVPAPASLPVMLAALLVLLGLVRAGRDRIRV